MRLHPRRKVSHKVVREDHELANRVYHQGPSGELHARDGPPNREASVARQILLIQQGVPDIARSPSGYLDLKSKQKSA